MAQADNTFEKDSVGRRDFFKGAALGAAGLVVGSTGEAATEVASGSDVASGSNVASGFSRKISLPPTPTPKPSSATPPRKRRSRHNPCDPGSDFMVDVLKKLDFEYVGGQSRLGVRRAARVDHQLRPEPDARAAHVPPRGGGSRNGARLRQGRRQADDDRWCTAPSGLLHSSMAVFQAWADRVPVFVIAAHNRNPATHRQPAAQRAGHGLARSRLRQVPRRGHHAAALRRLRHARLSLRDDAADGSGDAHRRCAAAGSAHRRSIAAANPGTLSLAAPPQGDANAVREAARLLVNAESPLIVSQKTGRTPRAWDLMLELADLLQAPVDVGGFGSWKDFPSWHPLHGTGGPGYTPDVTLGLEVSDMADAARTRARTAARRSASRASCCSRGATSTTSAATRTWTWRSPPTRRRRCRCSSRRFGAR